MLRWSARTQAAMQRGCHCLASDTGVECALQVTAIQDCYCSLHHSMTAHKIICTICCVAAIMLSMHAITLFPHAIMLFTHAIMLFAHATVLLRYASMLFTHYFATQA